MRTTSFVEALINKNLNTREFLLLCCRGMSACMPQANDPLDVPPAEGYEPDSHYAEKKLEAEIELGKLLVKTTNERLEHGLAIKAQRIEFYSDLIRESEYRNAKLIPVLESLKAWKPPTDEHNGLKRFAIEQIESCITSVESDQTALDAMRETDPEKLFEETVGQKQRDVKFYAREYAEEVARTNLRNEWLAALRRGLPEDKDEHDTPVIA